MIEPKILSVKDVEFLLEQVKKNPLFNKQFKYYTEPMIEEAKKEVFDDIDNNPFNFYDKNKNFVMDRKSYDNLKQRHLSTFDKPKGTELTSSGSPDGSPKDCFTLIKMVDSLTKSQKRLLKEKIDRFL